MAGAFAWPAAPQTEWMLGPTEPAAFPSGAPRAPAKRNSGRRVLVACGGYPRRTLAAAVFLFPQGELEPDYQADRIVDSSNEIATVGEARE